MTKMDISKDWCMNMAAKERDAEIGAGLVSPASPLDALERIHGLLGSVLTQALPSDDKIIIENIRKADEIALTAMRSLR